MKKNLLFVSLFASLITAVNAKAENFKTVDYVDRDRFMTSWYVQAGRFTPLEKDVTNAIEKYTWNEQKQNIEIDFSYNQGGFDGKLKKIPQTGYIENTKTNAHWKISPLWPLKFDYLVIALDPDYKWTAIGVPSEKYLWIMTKDQQVSKAKLDKIIKEIEVIGYPVDNLTIVPQQKR